MVNGYNPQDFSYFHRGENLVQQTLMSEFTKLLKVNWIKTILFNFRSLPFSKACKLPILIFGRVYTDGTKKGAIVLDCPVRMGLVRIGYVSTSWEPSVTRSTYRVLGKHVIKGNLSIGAGSVIVVHPGATLETGNQVWCNERTRIHCNESIIFGDKSLLAWDVQVMDSDSHYLLHNNRIKKASKPIYIGEGVWIGNRVSVYKGARIPNLSVVASNSVVNKDYSYSGTHILLAGTPSKVLGVEYQRVIGGVFVA